MGSLEHARRIGEIVSQGLPIAQREDEDYLRHTIRGPAHLAEFCNAATIAEWVHWANDNGELDHLTKAGARRIGLTLPLHDDAYPHLIERAYASWCAERDMSALVEEYASLPDYFTAERDAVGRLLNRDPRPDAVIGVYSDSGHNILAAAWRHGLRVPRDLLVACISEDPDYAMTTPPVTTVSLRPDQVGDEAVDLLIALINARTGVDRRRLVQPVLVPRQSTLLPAAP
jgi:DNA-binding LacI/PurR family transcriptional regulator